MISTNYHEKASKPQLFSWVGIVCFLFFLLTVFEVAAQTEYPWEKGSSAQSNQTSQSGNRIEKNPEKAETNALSQTLKFGDFQVRAPGNWMQIPASLEEEMGGAGVAKIALDESAVAIVVIDKGAAKDRIQFEKNLIKNVTSDSSDAIRHMDIMGNHTSIIRSFDDDGSSMFYIITYDKSFYYVFFIAYQQRISRLTPEVEAILSTIQKLK